MAREVDRLPVCKLSFLDLDCGGVFLSRNNAQRADMTWSGRRVA
jgi:hypothetical protein